MKITSFKARLVDISTSIPLVVGLNLPDRRGEFVTLQLMTDDGIEGVGLSFFGNRMGGALKKAVEALAELTIGEDPLRIEAIVDKLQRGMAGGPGGLSTLALAAVDIALWDIKGKALGLPVWKLAGGHRDRIVTYASGSLLRPYPVAYLAAAGPRFVEMGFKQMKMQLGTEKTVSQAVERVRVMREGIGDDIDLMCDINQLWNVGQAIEIGRRIEPYHLYWLEDVVDKDDYEGQARVRDALTTRICAGEYQFGVPPFRHMLEARSVDVVMIDLLRVGGITPWLKVAALAQSFNLPVVSHMLPEIHVHLVPAVPNGLTIEYHLLAHRLWQEMPALEDGELVVPQKPGLGLAFDEDLLRASEVS